MYPAPLALPYALFFLGYPREALRFFLLVLVASFVVAAVFLAHALHRRGLSTPSSSAFAAATLLLSYPVWFVYHQANMEFFVWVVLSIGLLNFFHRRPYAAGVCFGIAGAMKIFPFVYLGLLLARRKYRAVAVSIAAAALLTLVSLWVVYPDLRVSWSLTNAGIARFRDLFMIPLRFERGFDHSLFGAFKDVLHRLPPPPVLARLLSLYLLTAASAGIALYLLRIRKLPVINQLLALTVACILLPPTSFDYTLIHLYAPWALLLFHILRRYPLADLRSIPPPLLGIMTCLAILFSPLTEIIHHGETVAGPLRALILTLLFALALVFPIPDEPPRNGVALQADTASPAHP